MRWYTIDYRWRRRFAWLPVSLSDGGKRETIWLEWYWVRFCGDCNIVSFTDPN